MARGLPRAVRTRASRHAVGSFRVLLGLLVLAAGAAPSVHAGAAEAGPGGPAEPLPSVFVDLRAETWKPRGRVLFDVLAVIRKRLMEAGFPVVRTADAPHDLTLIVEYREAQGEPLDLMSARTIVTGRFVLYRDPSTPLLELRVQERTGDGIGGTPPYVDAIQRFETHPSVYFLGDLLRERLVGGNDRVVALLDGLRRELEEASVRHDPLSAPHTMLRAESNLPRRARQRAIRELGRRGDERAVPVLRDYLGALDRDTRAAAQEALARLDPGAVPDAPAGG